MMPIDDLRRVNLRTLAREAGSWKVLCERTSTSASQMSQWAKGYKDSRSGARRGMLSASCRRIEDAMGKPSGWLDADHSTDVVGTVAVFYDRRAPLIERRRPERRRRV